MRGRLFVAILLGVVSASGAWSSAGGAAATYDRRIDTWAAFSRVHSARKAVALTFDDGPSLEVTPVVLSLLARYRAHATFFDVGRRMLAHPDVALAEADAGMELANHTFHHWQLMNMSRRAVQQDVVAADDAFRSLGMAPPELFRPPFGKASPDELADVVALGHRVATWSVSIDRYALHRSTAAAVDALLARIRSGDILLAHDCCAPYDRLREVRVLSKLIPALQRRGYRIVTVTELLALGRI